MKKMNYIDEEKIENNKRVLVAIPNQYMLLQTKWYHSMYPEGIWEAIVIRFTNGKQGKILADIMYKRCIECGFFSKVYVLDARRIDAPLIKKIGWVVRYFFQYIFRCRQKYDEKLIMSITGRNDYSKYIIHSDYNSIETAMANMGKNKVVICMEDGFSDYFPICKLHNIRSIEQLLYFFLSKINVMSYAIDGYRYFVKYDEWIIKYCSLPEKIQYKKYKKIKQLFSQNIEKDKDLMRQSKTEPSKTFDLIIFSAPFAENFNAEHIYELLHRWIKDNYAGKKILIKTHPRENYTYPWTDLDITIDYLELSGEEVLDLFPETDILLLFTSTLLLKLCRDKRKFMLAYFEHVESRLYYLLLGKVDEIMGLPEESWVTI